MKPLSVHVEAVGLFAPGLTGWRDSLPVLAGERPYLHEPLPRYKPALLAGNERRRATDSVRIAFGACEDAVGDRTAEAASLASVFVSSGGDYGVHDQICRGLLQEQVLLSPTQFHNSVHNAPAGYWSIATGSRAPNVSLSAYDFSVAAGFTEALPFICQERQQTLLVFSDRETCEPLAQVRPVCHAFAVALWLTPQVTDRSIAELNVSLSPDTAEEARAASEDLEQLRRDNPAARLLPLLESLARGTSGSFSYPTAAGRSVVVGLTVP